jgi:hypothetical protein
VLVPGSGDDTVVGGPGDDTASFSDSTAAVAANLTQGTASGEGTDTLATIERLVGSSQGDRLTG